MTQAGPALWFGAPWPDVLTGIGTLALALFAAVTVIVTSRQAAGDRREALDQMLRARSRQAAEKILRVLAEEWPKLAMTGFGEIADYGRLQTELSLERPLLDDEQLQKRVEIVAGKIQDLLAYTLAIPGSNEPDVPRIVHARSRMSGSRNKLILEIGLYKVWVHDSLTAHVRGLDLPPMPSPRIGGKSRNLNDFSELYYPDDL
jgi:hypothetical protein